MSVDIQAVCEGIAANLATIRDRDLNLVKQVSPFPLDNPTGPSLLVHGVLEIEYTTFGGPGVDPGMRLLVAVEAWLGKASDIGSHMKLRRLQAAVGEESVVAAVESDARLTKRLDHSGELLEDQTPACEQISFEEYRGQTNFVAESGTTFLLATWVFEVLG